MKRTNVEVKKLEGKKLKELLGKDASKSSKIKELFDMGYETKEIANLLDIRYNFAYNVISNYVLINDIEVEKVRQNTKKDAAWKLFDQGKSIKEVAGELKVNYNYIWKLHKEWEAEAVKEVKKEEAK